MKVRLTKEEKQARWVAQGVALIQRPLRYIKNATAKTELVNGEKVTTFSKIFYSAHYAARVGDGQTVQLIARDVLSGYQFN